ncbi:glycosyl transferase family group 2-domain-containing protein [Mycotypha africana]|uniref:glycosyl transferase family group 2-domain-containing protein n=1 Tax=Mycotypha africana TaxID=64632 RepID=UPI002301AAA5|nr:glycosyl transferase family group 2-domain-containing protein [Mycotypha africana]KAI8982393.1 glycosyl transferase family group 2-domain-containing protein [Mycotypha africana]
MSNSSSRSRLSSPSEWVAPLTPIISLALLPLGPLLFPRFYVLFLFIYFSVFLYQQVNHVCKFYVTSSRMRAVIDKWNRTKQNDDVESFNKTSNHNDIELEEEQKLSMVSYSQQQPYQYIHTFVIPNYCEPEGLLKDTIGRLAVHRHANTNYVIILAMEASESGWEEKGHRIKEYFKDQFLGFYITGHPVNIPGEYRGKGSNVNYAVRQACQHQMIKVDNYDPRKIILTIMDSDAGLPELYILEVENALASRTEDPYYTICAPPIFFSRNCYQVPAAVRMTDITWAALVMSNLSNSDGLCVPCSNYSLSYLLAERVGFWDIGADAIGEDMHMWLKCFFKTDGMARTASIYVPINLTNVQCEGYFRNIYARYQQAKRHFQGVADLGYTISHTLSSLNHSRRREKLNRMNLLGKSLNSPNNSPSSSSSTSNIFMDCPPYSNSTGFFDKLAACSVICEAHIIPASSGWLMFAAVPLMQIILFPPFSWMAIVSPANNPLLTSDFFYKLWTVVKIITIFLPFPLFGTLAIYEHLHRYIDREFYHKPKSESRTWKNFLDYASLPIAAWLFLTLPSTIACVKRLLPGEDAYVVAAKTFNGEANVTAGQSNRTHHQHQQQQQAELYPMVGGKERLS